jgi:hypothetical protein
MPVTHAHVYGPSSYDHQFCKLANWNIPPVSFDLTTSGS